ncbi:MAG TPA: hypothetical protein VNW46_15130 [Gemmatimonadaceae bacterium]|jgi:hypothetical protein|nr:hypothetical protein [Gemmatimonadaceae bacterium]
MPDRPFQDPKTGAFIMAKPNLTMHGRRVGGPDNAQGTDFFMINDSGTYYLRTLQAARAWSARMVWSARIWSGGGSNP